MKRLHAESFFQNNLIVVLLAAVCGLLWGSAIPCVKISYELFQILPGDNLSKYLLAGLRFGMAGLVTLVFASVKNKKLCLPNKLTFSGILVLGLVQTALQYLFFYIGVSNTSGVKSSIFNATGTFIAVILSHFLYRNDKLNRFKVMGCIAGFAGVVVINLGSGGFDASFSFQGEGLILLSALMSALGAILSKNVASKGDPLTITGWQLFLGGGVLCIIGLMGGKLHPVGPQAFVMLFYLVCVSAVAFVFWTTLLKYNPVGKITIYNFMCPVFGVILSALLLGESLLNWRYLLALLLVCFGIFSVNQVKSSNG